LSINFELLLDGGKAFIEAYELYSCDGCFTGNWKCRLDEECPCDTFLEYITTDFGSTPSTFYLKSRTDSQVTSIKLHFRFKDDNYYLVSESKLVM